VLRYITADSLITRVQSPLARLHPVAGERYALDDHSRSGPRPALISLMRCLGRKSVENKSKDVPAVQLLIDLIDLRGANVTADAKRVGRFDPRAHRKPSII
jgi:hypothetical protein